MVSISLLVFNITHHLGKLTLILGTCLFHLGLILVSLIPRVIVRSVVRFALIGALMAVMPLVDRLFLLVDSLSMVMGVLIVAWGLGVGPVVVAVAVLVVIVVLVATLVLLVLLLL